MRFAIYIPGNTLADEQKLVAVGLPHLARGCAGIGTPVGPDGKTGVVFYWEQAGNPRSIIQYLPDSQEWIPAVASGELAAGRYWVGFTKGQMPTPQDLRIGAFKGREIVLGDGHAWCIPAAGLLPQKCEATANGWEFKIRDQFAAYWEESCTWYLNLITLGLNEDGSSSIDATCCDYLMRALGMNYLLTPEVVSRLELFGTDTIGPALKATVDWITIREEAAQKKTDDTPRVI